MGLFFFVRHKTAYEMRISDWSSDVCSSDLPGSTFAWTGGVSPVVASAPRYSPAMSPTRNISSAAITSSPLSSEQSHISMANRACLAWKDASNSEGWGGSANEGGARGRTLCSLGDEHKRKSVW